MGEMVRANVSVAEKRRATRRKRAESTGRKTPKPASSRLQARGPKAAMTSVSAPTKSLDSSLAYEGIFETIYGQTGSANFHGNRCCTAGKG